MPWTAGTAHAADMAEKATDADVARSYRLVSHPLGGFSVPLEAHFLKKKSAIVYLFVYFLRFSEKMHKIKKCVKV